MKSALRQQYEAAIYDEGDPKEMKRTLLTFLMMLTLATPASAFIVAGPAGEPITVAIKRDIFPLFKDGEQNGFFTYGILAIDTWEDHYNEQIKTWEVQIVYTTCDPNCRAVMQVFLFQSMPGLEPRVIGVSELIDWPVVLS